MTDERRRLDRLEERVQVLEDELAIIRLIASYGPLVDAGEADAVADLWAEDGTYDVEGWQMASRDDIRAMVESDGHQGLIEGGCTHFLGPAHVTLRRRRGGRGVRVGAGPPARGRLQRPAGRREPLRAPPRTATAGGSRSAGHEHSTDPRRPATCWPREQGRDVVTRTAGGPGRADHRRRRRDRRGHRPQVRRRGRQGRRRRVRRGGRPSRGRRRSAARSSPATCPTARRSRRPWRTPSRRTARSTSWSTTPGAAARSAGSSARPTRRC